MLVMDLIVKYHKIVPFPWSIRKLKKAGHSPLELMLRLGKDLSQCTDANSDTAKALVEMLNKLDLLDREVKKS